MIEFLLEQYLWLKALHIISFTCWMAGLLYLPRLFVYHAQSTVGSEKSETFKIMERRLLRAIMNPAMIATFLFGGLMMVAAYNTLFTQGWFHLKLLLVCLMSVCHALYARWRKEFERDENKRTHIFYRWWNEAPTVLMIVIILLAVAKPF